MAVRMVAMYTVIESGSGDANVNAGPSSPLIDLHAIPDSGFIISAVARPPRYSEKRRLAVLVFRQRPRDDGLHGDIVGRATGVQLGLILPSRPEYCSAERGILRLDGDLSSLQTVDKLSCCLALFRCISVDGYVPQPKRKRKESVEKQAASDKLSVLCDAAKIAWL